MTWLYNGNKRRRHHYYVHIPLRSVPSALVYEDGRLVNPKINERKQKLFDEAEKQFKSNYYKNELVKLEARMSVFLDKYCST